MVQPSDPNGSSMQLDIDFTDANNNDNFLFWCDENTTTPGNPNVLCSTVDHDGDGQSPISGDCDDSDALEEETLDLDNDGFTTCGYIDAEGVQNIDCDDTDPLATPRDNDGWCNDLWFGQRHLDHWMKAFQFLDSNNDPQQVDCNDLDPTLNPFDEDEDGLSSCGGDCDDGDISIGIIDEDGDGANACRTDCDDECPWIRILLMKMKMGCHLVMVTVTIQILWSESSMKTKTDQSVSWRL